MATPKEKFVQATREALCECARWLDDNADVLADNFADDNALGCKSWSLSFTFDPERYPTVVVDTDCKAIAVIDGTYSA